MLPVRKARRAVQQLLSWCLALALLALAWQAALVLGRYPAYILPAPLEVLRKGVLLARQGVLLRHVLVTSAEILAGLALGASSAVVAGYLVSQCSWGERILTPFVVASQAVPTVAVAPLIVIWFGFGLLSKVVVCALIVFFPMLVSTMVGLRAVPPELAELMQVLRATRWQMLLKLQLPAALPVILGGLRLSVTLAVVGAIVGEFVGADRGLGFLVNLGKGTFDTALMFVALALLVVMALGLYGAALALERKLLHWRP
jgi:NitT/TauT family transport system permease protein